MAYIDFVCIPLAKDRMAEYLKTVKNFSAFMHKQGVLAYQEASADDVPKGEQTDFYRAVKANGNETVVAAYLKWPDKATRDKAWETCMNDPMMQAEMPFDTKRMIWGGFNSIFES